MGVRTDRRRIRAGLTALLLTALLVTAQLLVACAGEGRADPRRTRVAAEPQEEAGDEPASPIAAAAPAPAARPEEEPAPAPDFESPLPTTPCPDAVQVALAHAEHALPPALGHAVAMRSEDGRRIRVVLADAPLQQDALGRFEAPSPGGARFEMDARRTRRGPLEPRVLGTPESARGGLTHARVVTADAALTFGTREIGSVELTEITDDHVCGRIELDDGFTRVRGAFRAPLQGELPR